MPTARVLLDEHVAVDLAHVLRANGFDVVAAEEVGLKGADDPDILMFAVGQERAVLTFNTQDFAPLARMYAAQGIANFGIIFSTDESLSVLISRMRRLLSQRDRDDLRDLAIWLNRFR